MYQNIGLSGKHSNKYKQVHGDIRIKIINCRDSYYFSCQKFLSTSLIYKQLMVSNPPFYCRIHINPTNNALMNLMEIQTITGDNDININLPVVLYSSETWSSTSREDHKLQVLENEVIRKIRYRI
jgi:hypothetical protein